MLLLKTSFKNLPGVLTHSKHASDRYPSAGPGDLVLIAITRTTLPKGEKSIQHVARLGRVRRDTSNESSAIWGGTGWFYIIELDDIRDVDPFNLEEVQESAKNYGPVVTHVRLLPQDEDAVLRRLP